jgi:hypothetical protein
VLDLGIPDDRSARAFKTAWFSKAARKARIRDGALLQAVREAMRGQADDPWAAASSRSG